MKIILSFIQLCFMIFYAAGLWTLGTVILFKTLATANNHPYTLEQWTGIGVSFILITLGILVGLIYHILIINWNNTLKL